MANYTNDYLLRSIRRRILMAQASLKTFDDTDILAFCDEEIATRLFPVLIAHRQEYGVYRLDVPLVPGRPDYRITSRALVGKLRSLHLVTASGAVEPLIEKNAGDAEILDATTQGSPGIFFLEANSVVLRPVPNSADHSLRMSFYIRPNQLVNQRLCGTIQELDGSNVVVSGPASGWDELKRYDILRGTPGFEHFAIDQTPATFADDGNGNYTFTFDPDVDVSRLEVGDHVCLAGEAPVAQIPADLHPILAQRVAVKLLEGQGDDAGLERARMQLSEMEQIETDLLSPRVQDQRQVVQSYARRWLG